MATVTIRFASGAELVVHHLSETVPGTKQLKYLIMVGGVLPPDFKGIEPQSVVMFTLQEDPVGNITGFAQIPTLGEMADVYLNILYLPTSVLQESIFNNSTLSFTHGYISISGLIDKLTYTVNGNLLLPGESKEYFIIYTSYILTVYTYTYLCT